MKKRSSKLIKIIALAEAEERRCGAATGEYRRRLDEQRSRLAELDSYRQTYRGQSKSVTGVTAAQWKDYQGFLGRLDLALEAQRQIISDSEQKLEMHRRQWQAKRQRLQSLERALERYQQEERQQDDRRRQRADDDRPAPTPPYGDE